MTRRRPPLKLHQIFYDAASKAALSPHCLPLDNIEGRQDWFEFWPILNFLRTNELDPDTWYGFVSPKFFDKSGARFEDVEELLAANPEAEVALFSHHWVGLVLFKNPWVQGDRPHPGLLEATERFLRDTGTPRDLREIYTDFSTAVLSNYVVAKPTFWRRWQELARAYFEYCETGAGAEENSAQTQYHARDGYAMKVFVQERLASLVLLQDKFETVHFDYPRRAPMPPEWHDRGYLRRLLAQSERMKSAYIRSGNRIYRRGARVAVRIAQKLNDRLGPP